MAKIRVFEWAKKNKMPSNVIITDLKEKGVQVRTHTSLVEESVLDNMYNKSKSENKITEHVKIEETPSDKKSPSGYEGNKPSTGYQGNKPSTGYQGNKPSTGYQGNKPSTGYQGNKPSTGYQGNKPSTGYQGNKPSGGYQGNKPSGGYQGNKPSGGYQGNKPSGGYQGNKPTGGYQGNKPTGGYQGNKPTGGYQGNKPSGGYQGNKPTGGYQGNKPTGGYQGNKPTGGYQNNRFSKPEEKPEQTTKPVSKKASNYVNKKKQTDYNKDKRNQENLIKVDQRTKTQIKKEARKLREEELKKQTSTIKWSDDMTVGKFAHLLEIPSIDVISKLFELGLVATLNQTLDVESAEILCTDYNVEIVEDDTNDEFEFENMIPIYEEEDLEKRPPIVTIMGHVDHGKTTLLDTIRKTNVTAKESGGITQHIGAYQVDHNGKKTTFLDTPGHAAFTAMRARGAQVTDITVLVVAADDGVMPQTKEAIAHAKDAKTPLIVAVNKMDREGANPERVMSELAELQVLSEEWGGDVPFVKISALKGEGIDELLSYIDVIAEMHDKKAKYNVPGFGTVIEAHLDKGRGPVATILVEGGEVNISDSIIIGHTWGSIRVMQDEYGIRHKNIGPSMPVEVTGLKDVPQAGDKFLVLKDNKKAQAIGEKRASIKAQKDRNAVNVLSLDELNAKIAEGSVKELPVIIKADVQGSVEALASSLEQIEVNGVKVRIVHKAVGAISESDVLLAQTGNAIMIGFNVRPDTVARRVIEKEGIELIQSSIIYKIIEEIEDSMRGMREKIYRETIMGYARVDEIFKITGVGKVAGCIITEGKITRSCKVRLIRDNIVAYDGDLGQLKRFKDNVSEVVEGMDCGMSFKDFNDIKKGDQFEGYILEEENFD